MTRIWWNLIRALESLQNLHFDLFLLCRVFGFWPKKVQRSYFSWQWRVMQNLEKNWLVVWKMTWGIWQIFTRALQSLKIGTLIRFFNPKKKMYELKIYRAVKCHGNEEWYKIWRGSDLLFQNWHEEFAKFWPEHLKVSKSFILIWPFWAKYMLFELKKCRWVIFHDTEKGYNIWREIDLRFKIDIRNLKTFDLSTQKSQKLWL